MYIEECKEEDRQLMIDDAQSGYAEAVRTIPKTEGGKRLTETYLRSISQEWDDIEKSAESGDQL
jgi:hypothetical protein